MSRKKLWTAALGLALIALAIAPAPLRAQEQTGGKFSLKLYGGASYMSGGDLNNGLAGQAKFWMDFAQAIGYSVSGNFSNARFGVDAGGDLIFQIAPQIGIGIGAGFIQASKQSSQTLTSTFETVTQIEKPEAYAVPVRLSLFYTIPASPGLSIVLHAGVGAYFAHAKSLWSLATSTETIDSLTTDTKATGFGVHGGIAFEFAVSRSLGLFLEIAGRYANFAGFKGTGSETAADTTITTGASAALYYYETTSMLGGTTNYGAIYAFDTKPADLTNVREAKVDFSGASIRIGFTVHM